MSDRVLPSGPQIELAWGEQRVTVVGVGGGLRSFRIGDWAVLDGYGPEQICPGAAGQALIPWPNRIRDGFYRFAGQAHQLPLSEPERLNAIHGLVRWLPWEPGEHSASSARLRCRLFPSPGYPFSLLLENEYRLGEDGLVVRTVARNLGSEPCPYGCGFHPYLSLGEPSIDSAVLQSPAEDWLPADERLIPVGRRPLAGGELDFRRPRQLGGLHLDNAFAELERDGAGRAWVELSQAQAGRRVRLWMDSAYRYLMLFTGDGLAEPERRRRALGVEPMTCAPNAFQTGEGLVSLQPGQTHSCSWGLVAEHL